MISDEHNDGVMLDFATNGRELDKLEEIFQEFDFCRLLMRRPCDCDKGVEVPCLLCNGAEQLDELRKAHFEWLLRFVWRGLPKRKASG